MADEHIKEVRNLLKEDPGDFRNQARLKLVEANRSLLIPHLHQARSLARSAFTYAEEHSDVVMMARARLRQAGIEYFAMGYEKETRPALAVQQALDYARRALPLAEQTNNFRTQVRIHTLIAQLHAAESPYQDLSLAAHHVNEAHAIVYRREGMGHLTDPIASLYRKLEAMRTAVDDSPLAVITSVHLDRSLDITIRQLEVAIMTEAQKRFGESDVILSKLLRVGHERVARILGESSALGTLGSEVLPGQYVIARIAFGFVLTEGLEGVVQVVEHEIVRAAMKKHNYNEHAVRDALNIGHARYERHAEPLKGERRAAAAGS